jgi:hypothetical protein
MKVNFDEWMSGRYWLGDKSPAEGFYGRYGKRDLELMEIAYINGYEGDRFRPEYLTTLSENQQYLIEWCTYVGRKLNENN